jgi:ABC-type spermidine/putrescine transport system permease subunit II
MIRKMSSSLYLLVLLACIVPLTMSLVIATHGPLGRTFNCLLSTEVITPALIVGVALVISFVRRRVSPENSKQWRKSK